MKIYLAARYGDTRRSSSTPLSALAQPIAPVCHNAFKGAQQ
jgi:hypothetical protein